MTGTRYVTHLSGVAALLALSVVGTASAQGETTPAPTAPAPTTAPQPAPTSAEATPAPGTAPAGETETAPEAAPVQPTDPAQPSTADTETEDAPDATGAASAGTGSTADLDAQAEATAAELLAAKEQAEADALAAELLGNEDEVAEIDPYGIDFYGFVDFMYSHNVKDYGFFNPYSSFAVGRFNLYMAADLGDNWRTLLETRFTYLPHGSLEVDPTPDWSAPPPTEPVARANNLVTDYIDIDRPIRWGGVVIERAWLEKSYETWLNIRMGHWLTPYGIWNVDHGSPVIIGVRRPFIVGEALLPESQSGIQLYGSYNIDALRIGYAATVSNGRGPADVYRDFDGNKALGGRLFASYDTLDAGVITLGASGYAGTYTERDEITTFGLDGSLQTDRPIVNEYNETSLAGDLKWAWDGFLFQSEVILHDTTYEEDTRPFLPPSPFGPGGYLADTQDFGAYVLTGYRFDFLGTMPWIGWEYYAPGGVFEQKAAAFWGGFNFRPTPRVVLKAQYTYSYFPDSTAEQELHFNNLDFQAAWSF